MIKPHGSAKLTPLYVENDEQRAALLKEAETLPKLLVNSATAANAVMLGAGYFTPLTGYMNKADAISVANNFIILIGNVFSTNLKSFKICSILNTRHFSNAFQIRKYSGVFLIIPEQLFSPRMRDDCYSKCCVLCAVFAN